MKKVNEYWPVIVFSKGRAFGEFWVKGRARPSVLGKALEVLNEHGILARNIVVHHEGDEEVSLILADMTDATDNVDVVISKLSALPGMLEVDFRGPRFNYMCKALGPLVNTSKAEEVIVVVLKCFIEMLQGVKACFGSSGEVFLWYLAREIGSSTAKLLDAKLEGLSAEERVRAHLAFLSSAGWGVFELKRVDLTKGLIEVRARNAFEVRHRKGSSKTPQCLFMKGYLAGMMSAHLSVKGVRAEEVSCEARGDEVCSFTCRLG